MHTYLYMYIYIQICIFTHICTICICTYVHTFPSVCIYTHMNTQIHKHTNVHAQTHSCLHTYIHTYTHMHTSIYTCLHTSIPTHRYTDSYTHVHTHTHIQALRVSNLTNPVCTDRTGIGMNPPALWYVLHCIFRDGVVIIDISEKNTIVFLFYSSSLHIHHDLYASDHLPWFILDS